MKFRPRTFSLHCILAASLVTVSASSAAAEGLQRASYQEGRRGRITSLLENVHWGMSPQAVFAKVKQEIASHYREEIQATLNDPTRIAHIEAKRDQALRRVRNSFVRFGSTPDGWDSSLIADEFSRDNGESMLVYRHADTERYYFFQDGRLWKIVSRLTQVDASQDGYRDFVRALQRRLGKAKAQHGALVPNGDKHRWAEFSDAETRLRVERHSALYSSIGLVLEDRRTLRRISEDRLAAAARNQKPSPHMDLALSRTGNPHADADVVDRILKRQKYTDPEL